MHGIYHGYYNMWGGMAFGWLLGLAFLVLVVLLIIRLVRNTNGSGQIRTKSALDILKERYARGEISLEEFREKKKEIQD